MNETYIVMYVFFKYKMSRYPAKGQVIRVSAVLHVLFCANIDYKEEIIVNAVLMTASSQAVILAWNFVDTCC